MGCRQIAGPERVVLLGALAMLVASAGLGAAGAASGGPAGTALDVHANAGSLGWMALGSLAVALAMLPGDHSDPGPQRRARIWLAWFAVAVLVGVGAIGSPTTAAAAATAVLVASTTFVAWLAGVHRRMQAARTVPRLGMAAALIVLLAGLVLGVIAAWMTVGGDAATAAQLTTAESATTAVPFVMLLATAAVEWQSDPPVSDAPVTTGGLVQVGLFVLAAIATIVGVLSSNLALTEANTSLVLAGIAIFGARVGPRLLAAVSARGSRIWPVASALALAVDAGLFVHVVFEVGAQRYASAGQVPSWLAFAVDHVTFVGVGTTALLGAIAMRSGLARRWLRLDALAAAGLMVGLVGMALGLGTGSTAGEEAAGTLLGLSVVAAVAIAGLRVWLAHEVTAGGKTMPVP